MNLAVQLVSIAYASSASRKLDSDELRTLRDEWFTFCSVANITGLILYRDGDFVGYLEGEAEALTRVFAVIRVDPRHRFVTVVLNEPCREREFNAWSMGASLPVDAARNEPGVHKPGHDLLRAMWEKSR